MGSSLTCFPPLQGLLGACSSVVESLSCSYHEYVSVSMVLQDICQVYVWFVENENLVPLSPISKCVPNRKGLWGNMDNGNNGVLTSDIKV